MPEGSVNWEPALVVLTSGLVFGLLLVLWVRRRAAASPAPPLAGDSAPLELRDLDGRVAALVVQLRELEDAAAKRTPEQLARERYALELEAARALQARDTLASRVTPAPATTPAAVAPPSAARGFVWGAVSSAVVAVMLFLVFQAAQQRPEGGSVTGSVEGGRPRGGMAPGGSSDPGEASPGAEAEVPPDAETLELRARLAKTPDDHDTRLALARHLLMQRDLMGVWNETQYVLERQPGHARALTYQSLVRLAMGQGDVAVSMLKQAIAAEPDLLEARQNLAFVYASLGRPSEAAAEVAEIAKHSPAEAQRLKHALEQLAQSKQEAPPTEAHTDVPPPAETASARAAPAAPAASGAGGGVFGWIEADAAVASRIPPGSVIFLTVRPAGVSSGPPAAVKRLQSSAFPLQFEVGAGDSMMGQPLPDSIRIDVRADSDGDPLTRPATDPAGFADGIALGKTGVRIALK
jgi:tetratricopeptide (TPR) repeat protein